MACNKWHQLNNLDECVQSKLVNVGLGKLHMKNHTEKWGGWEDFVDVVMVVVFLYVRVFALIL